MKQVVNVLLITIVLQVLVLASLVLVKSFMVEDLGQNHWASVPTACISKLNIKNIDKKYRDRELYMEQQVQHTGFIPLSPLQFGHIRNCSTCQVNKKWLQQPVKLYEYVKSFNCPNF